MRLRLLTALLAGLLIAVGCTAGSSAPKAGSLPSVLVGEVDGGKALIAVVRSRDGLTIYSCGRGPALATHTGWFFGVPRVDGEGQVIPKLRSAGGLELEGRITGETASGTLTLVDGETVSWSARAAEGGGGLYQAEDTLALTGLVVANDGRTAGNARLNTGVVSGGATAPTTTPTTTATTTTTRPTTTTTRPTTTAPTTSVAVAVSGAAPANATDAVNVTFPAGGVTTTVPLQPVLDPARKTIARNGHAVVFLVHGMSDKITPEPPAPQLPACDGLRNTPFYSRCEWGADFIPGLFGNNPATNNSLFTLAGDEASGSRYLELGRNVPLVDERLGITARAANGCQADPLQQPGPLGREAAHHFVTTPRPVRGTPPKLSVFATYRESTDGVVASGHRIANQVYAALKWYEQEYQITPAVYFVVQSFGGLATRFLLSNPARPVYNTPLLNADRVFVCPEDHAKMDYLRDRTVLAQTLATPHEGSYLSEWGEDGKDRLRNAARNLRTNIGNSPLAAALRLIDEGIAQIPGGPPPLNLVGQAQGVIDGFLAWLDTPALRDMKLATMTAFNLGPLSPERARRSPASPIVGAQGALVPIYATLGRSPGGAAFDTPKIIEGISEYSAETQKERGWIFTTMFLSDVITQLTIPDGYGRVDVPPYAASAALLDRRSRLLNLSTETTQAEQFVEAAAASILERLDVWFGGRFGPAVDGVVDYLTSLNLQVTLPNSTLPIHVDRVWRLGLTGSVEVPMLALACGQSRVVIDYEPLVQALLAGERRTDEAFAAVRTLDLRALLNTAFGAGADAGEATQDAVAWFQGKLREIDALTADCRLPLAPESLADLLNVKNIVNWRITRVTGTVPAPAWERTNTVARDREMDTDGAVHSASALGFTLGRRPFFFEHDRADGPVVAGRATLGSWYRLPDNPVTEQYNHGLQYQNDVAREVARRVLNPAVGPVPQRTGDSFWP
jgi:hypothetical protein